ncbi:hypothetical protein ACFQGT_11945 [Natrialbaceae archaeon GCM10025810]|uniref:hypothetical protein n=1 Tax=Halovalidus salilacus TaxID=3075124 RepID=UPI0036190C44
MSDTPSIWDDVRGACDRLEPGAALRTPVSDRTFSIESTSDDRIVVRFREGPEERTLRRDQLETLLDQFGDGTIPLAALPPGVEPYVSVASLSGEFVLDEGDGEGPGELRYAPEEAGVGESPLLVQPEEARTPPERVRDDALLLADFLEHEDAEDPESLETETMTDLYVLLSDVQRGSDRLRRSVRDPLLDRLGPDQEARGWFGTVRRTTRERRHPKNEETVLDALDEHGIPHEWVLGVDQDKLDVVLAVTDLDEEDVYDVERQVYAQKTGVDETEKFSRLEGLAAGLEEVDDEAAADIREDLLDVESRLQELLSAG